MASGPTLRAAVPLATAGSFADALRAAVLRTGVLRLAVVAALGFVVERVDALAGVFGGAGFFTPLLRAGAVARAVVVADVGLSSAILYSRYSIKRLSRQWFHLPYFYSGLSA